MTLRITPNRTDIKVKIWQDGQPLYKDKGDEKAVRKKLANFFKFK